MAEGEGFEPPEGLHPQRFSRPPQSTALPPLRRSDFNHLAKHTLYSEPRIGTRLAPFQDDHCSSGILRAASIAAVASLSGFSNKWR